MNKRTQNPAIITVALTFLCMIFVAGCISTSSEIIEPPSQEALPFEQITPTVMVNASALELLQSGNVMEINKIQGNGHVSPHNQQEVENLVGIVTVKRADGFYMQSLNPDDDLKTSEGIFVFLNKPPRLNVGDLVLVNGKVTEFFPGGVETGNLSITQIENPEYEIVSNGNQTPKPVIIGKDGRIPPDQIIDDDRMGSFDLGDGIDFFESLESMLVEIRDPLAVSPTSAYKEIAVVVDSGIGATGMNQRGGLTIKSDDFNPERIILDDSLASLPDLKVGDQLETPIIGVIDYTFGNYKLQAIHRVRVIKGNLEPERTEINTEDGSITVASYNVENLGADDAPERFMTLADQIVNSLNSPDILALQEIQDDNGPIGDDVTSATLTYQKIIEAISAIGGPTYTAVDVPPLTKRDGGEPGGNIRVGVLYRTDTGLTFYYAPNGGPKDTVYITESGDLSLNPGRIDPTNFAFVDSRKPVVAEFLYNDKKIFLVNNHWNSKGGDTPLFGQVQPPRLESENQRTLQAGIVSDFVNELMKSSNEPLIIVLGDLNDFYFSNPVQELTKAGLLDLMMELPLNERYTYIYDGNSQNLDNFLISPALKAYFSQIDVVHLNSEFPDRHRFSDHDPIVVQFTLNQ